MTKVMAVSVNECMLIHEIRVVPREIAKSFVSMQKG
jgi:hypothetical protein